MLPLVPVTHALHFSAMGGDAAQMEEGKEAVKRALFKSRRPVSDGSTLVDHASLRDGMYFQSDTEEVRTLKAKVKVDP